MFDHIGALALIEQAEREQVVCDCGKPILPVGRPDGVWLACATLSQPKTTLRRLVTLDFAVCHTDHQIVDLRDFTQLRAA